MEGFKEAIHIRPSDRRIPKHSLRLIGGTGVNRVNQILAERMWQ